MLLKNLHSSSKSLIQERNKWHFHSQIWTVASMQKLYCLMTNILLQACLESTFTTGVGYLVMFAHIDMISFVLSPMLSEAVTSAPNKRLTTPFPASFELMKWSWKKRGLYLLLWWTKANESEWKRTKANESERKRTKANESERKWTKANCASKLELSDLEGCRPDWRNFTLVKHCSRARDVWNGNSLRIRS